FPARIALSAERVAVISPVACQGRVSRPRSSDARYHPEEKRARPSRYSQTRGQSLYCDCDIYAVNELTSEDKPFAEILMWDVQTPHLPSPWDAAHLTDTNALPFASHSRQGSGAPNRAQG